MILVNFEPMKIDLHKNITDGRKRSLGKRNRSSFSWHLSLPYLSLNLQPTVYHQRTCLRPTMHSGTPTLYLPMISLSDSRSVISLQSYCRDLGPTHTWHLFIPVRVRYLLASSVDPPPSNLAHIHVSGEGLVPIVSAYSRLILVDGTVLWAIICW